MKKLIILIVLLIGVASANAQISPPNLLDKATALARSVTLPSATYTTAFKDALGAGYPQYGYYWKYTGNPKLWTASDTSETFNLSMLKDTLFTYFLKSTATTGYRAAIHIQFGSGVGPLAVAWRPLVFLDSTSKGGTSNITYIGTKDSVVVGRTLYHVRMAGANAACNYARLVVVKDTTNCANSSGQYTPGFIFNK